MKDKFGEPIEVDSVITYPVRRGSEMFMVDGLVISTEAFLVVRPVQERHVGSIRPRTGESVIISNLSTVTVLPHIRATPCLTALSGLDLIAFDGDGLARE